MKITKTWFNYLLWGIFFVILFVSVGIAANGLAQEQTDFMYILSIVSMYLISFISIFVIILLAKASAKFYMKFEEKLPDFSKADMPAWLEYSMLVLVMLMNIAIRAVIIVSATNNVLGNDSYYRYAIGEITAREFGTMSNGAYVYVALIRFMNSILGVKAYSAMCLQLILQLAILTITYFMVKRIFGKWQAWTSLVIMSFLPFSFVETARLTPDMFLAFLILLTLNFTDLLCKANVNQKIKSKAYILLYLLIGLAIGFVIYMDPIGIALLIACAIMFANSNHEDPWLSIQKSWFQILVVCITAILFFVFLTYQASGNGLEDGFDALVGYIKIFATKGLDLQILTPGYGYKEAIVLFILAGLAFFGFLIREEDGAFPYLIIVIAATINQFAGFDTSEYTQISILMWTLIAGFGITSLYAFGAKAISPEEISVKQRRKEQRRLAKEAKLDRKANMKSITLAPPPSETFSDKPSKKSMSSTPGRKGYGIGKPVAKDNVETTANKVTEAPAKPAPTVVNTKPAPTRTFGGKENIGTIVGKPVSHEEVYVKKAPEKVVTLEEQPKEKYINEIVKEEREAITEKVIDNDKPMLQPMEEKKLSVTPIVEQQIAPKLDKPIVTQQTPKEETIATNTSKQELTNEIKKSSSGYSGGINDSKTTQQTTTSNDYYSVLDGAGKETNTDNTLDTSKQQGSLIKPITDKKPDTINDFDPDREENHSNTPLGTEHRVAMPSRRTLKPEYMRGISLNGTPVVPKMPSDITSTPAPGENVIIKDVTPSLPIQPSETEAALNNQFSNEKEKPPIGQSNYAKDNATRSDSNYRIGAPLPGSSAKPQSSMIKNPLPGPRQHVPKQLDYDFVPRTSEMGYDIEDLKGKDYYDI